MSGEDRGTIAKRLPPEPAPADGPLQRYDGQKDPGRRSRLEAGETSIYAAPEDGEGEAREIATFFEYRKTATIFAAKISEPFEVDTLEGLHRGKAGDFLAVGVHGEMYPIDAAVMASSYESVVGEDGPAGTPSAKIPRLELVYVGEQHRLHASPKEQCNVDDAATKTRIPEEKLSSVSPDVSLCEHCVSEEEARIIRAGLRRV